MLLELFVTNIIAVFLVYLSQRKGNKLLLYYSAFLLCIVYGIRYNFGNDYWNYFDIFKNVQFDNEDRIEIGWLYLNKAFINFGFFSLVFCITCFQINSVYYFISKYVERSYWWFSVAIFTGTFNFLLLGCSMMRQFTAMIILVYSIQYIAEKKFIKFIFTILIACLMHQTAIIFAPMYFLSVWQPNINKIKIIVFYLCVVLILFLFAHTYIDYLITASLFTEEDHFTGYLDREGRDVSATAFLDFIWLILLMKYVPEQKIQKIICTVSIISFLIFPFTFALALLLRLMLYFSFFFIFSLPNMVAKFKSKAAKALFIIFYLSLMMRRSLSSLISDTYFKDYEIFHTILSANNWL